MRAIDADSLIKLVTDSTILGDGFKYTFVALVNGEPTIQPESHWIPVSERLPKYGTTVLITNDKGNVQCGRFRGVEFWKEDGDNYWTWKKNTIEYVVAWMPMPKSYKGEENESR